MTSARFGLLLCLVVLGSCDMPTNSDRLMADKKSTREFYLQCVDTIMKNSYGRASIDSLQECRQAAVQIK